MTVCRENVRIDGIKSPATNHGESSLHARVNKMLNISAATAEMETIFFFHPSLPTSIYSSSLRRVLLKILGAIAKDFYSPRRGQQRVTCPRRGPRGHPHFQACIAFFVFSTGSLAGLQCFRCTIK